MTDHQQDRFDRVLGSIEGLPDVRKSKPSTTLSVMPLLGNAVTHVVQTYRSPDFGFLVFLQIVDAEGRSRILLPDKVCQAIYRQRAAVLDTSTPASRARKRVTAERARTKKAKAKRQAARRANGGTSA